MTTQNTPAMTPVPLDHTTDDATRAELDAINISTQALAAIDDQQAHARIMRYLADRFGLTAYHIFPDHRRNWR